MFVDGKEVPYIKADYLLRAVYVPAGTHTVKMIFEPEVICQRKNHFFRLLLVCFCIFFGGDILLNRKNDKRIIENIAIKK